MYRRRKQEGGKILRKSEGRGRGRQGEKEVRKATRERMRVLRMTMRR